MVLVWIIIITLKCVTTFISFATQINLIAVGFRQRIKQASIYYFFCVDGAH